MVSYKQKHYITDRRWNICCFELINIRLRARWKGVSLVLGWSKQLKRPIKELAVGRAGIFAAQYYSLFF